MLHEQENPQLEKQTADSFAISAGNVAETPHEPLLISSTRARKFTTENIQRLSELLTQQRDAEQLVAKNRQVQQKQLAELQKSTQLKPEADLFEKDKTQRAFKLNSALLQTNSSLENLKVRLPETDRQIVTSIQESFSRRVNMLRDLL